MAVLKGSIKLDVPRYPSEDDIGPDPVMHGIEIEGGDFKPHPSGTPGVFIASWPDLDLTVTATVEPSGDVTVVTSPHAEIFDNELYP